MRAALFLLLALTGAGCLSPAVSLEECEAMCQRHGTTIREYHVGSSFPIFRPRPPVICGCQDGQPHP